MKINNKKEVKISVIIPVYNTAEYLPYLCTDIDNQTYTDFEVIFIDDGSQDNSLEILEKYASGRYNIKVIKEKHKGVSNARNVGLSHARGKYIRFLDSDDRIPKDSMEKLVYPIESLGEDIELVIANYRLISEITNMTGEGLEEKRLRGEDFVLDFIRYFETFYIGSNCNKLYKNEIIKKYNIQFDRKARWCEDLIFNIDYLMNIDVIYRVNTKLGVYDYINRSNTSNNTKSNNEHLYSVENIKQLRMKKGEMYCKKYNRSDDFLLYWKYDSLLADISIISKNKELTLSERYIKFCTYLKDNQVEDYLILKEKIDGNYDKKQYKLIKVLIQKKYFILGFIFYYIKGIISSIIKGKE